MVIYCVLTLDGSALSGQRTLYAAISSGVWMRRLIAPTGAALQMVQNAAATAWSDASAPRCATSALNSDAHAAVRTSRQIDNNISMFFFIGFPSKDFFYAFMVHDHTVIFERF
jgi:hypothetical protein